MAYIGRQLARGENKLFDDISSSFNGSTTTFNLTVSSVATATATAYQLFVSLGGVMQKPNTDFTTAGNQITFTTAPAAGLSCWIMMQGDTIDQAAIPDSSVTPSKIAGSGDFAFPADIRLKDSDGSHYVGFQAPTTVSTNKVWTLPAADGTASQYLQTNGSGVLTWATVSIGGGTGIDFNDNVKARWGTGNDLEIFHNSSNSVINDAGTGDLLLQVGGTTQATISSTGVVIANNLTVSGTTTTINTQTLDVEDKNVVIGKVSSPSDTTADGGGWTLKGASDKTFNWVNATDAWTSSEHIHLLDNKKLLVGGASGTVDGLEIVHNGSNSILNDTGTGTLQLQLGGSTKLEVTSGGINVTGAITVDGAALSTAPEITAVASGTLPNGTAVILNSDGTVTKAGLADATFNSAQTPKTTSCHNLNCVHFDTNLIGIVYTGSGGDMEVIGATVSNHTLTFGTAVTHGSMAGNIKCAMNSDNTYGKRCGVVWHNGNYSSAKFSWFVVNANRTITFSQDDTAIWNGEAITYLGIGPSTGGGREWNVSFVRNGDGTVYVQSHGSSSNGNNTPSSRRTVSAGGRNPVIAGGIGMSATNGLIAYTKDSDDDLYVRTIQGSGGSSAPTIGSETKIYTGTVANPTGAYAGMIDLRCDPRNHGSYLIYGIAFRDTSSNKLYLRMLKVASGASSLSTFDSDTNHEIASHQGRDITLAFDRENRAGFTPYVHVAYMRTDDSDKGYLQSATFNGTTVGSFTQAIFQTADMNTAGGDLLTGLAPTGSTADMVILYKDPTSGGDGSNSLRSKVRVGSASNVQANNVLGFTKAAYTNGQTATISVNGAVSENQSSLTTGTVYFIKQDGTLGTVAESPRSGADAIALSATKILVKI